MIGQDDTGESVYTCPVESFAEKLVCDVSRVFVWGDTPENPWNHLKQTLKAKPVAERELLRAMLTTVRNALPRELTARYQQAVFNNAPLDVSSNGQERSLKRVGSGAVNTVFLLEGDGTRSWAVGIRRKGFNNGNDALKYAICQQKEYERIKERFVQVPELVPEEARIVFDRHDGKAGVMFFREFVEGPIRDVFDLSRQELDRVVTTNEKFCEQMLGFVTISMENISALCTEHFDVLGKNNLVVAGSKGNESLVLLEPHNCESSNSKDRTDQRIEDRVLYLREVISGVCQ